MTTQDADRTRTGRIVQLSVELLGVPKNELCKVFEHFEDALTAEIFSAVQDIKETFEVTFVNLKGKEITEVLPEEHIAASEGWEKWLAAQRQASRFHVIKVTEEFRIDAATITVPGEFEMLANLRMKALQERKKEADRAKKHGKTQPEGKVTPPLRKTESRRADGSTVKTSRLKRRDSARGAEVPASPEEVDSAARDLALANE